MLAEPTSFSFSGHETFPFRYPWLKKGFDAVRTDPLIFQQDDAITSLGVDVSRWFPSNTYSEPDIIATRYVELALRMVGAND